MLAVQSHVTMPVLGSLASIKTGTRSAVQRVALDCPSTNVTLALRMSPASASKSGSPVTAVMSWIVARSVTVAVVAVAEPVDANCCPTYVARASSCVTVSGLSSAEDA